MASTLIGNTLGVLRRFDSNLSSQTANKDSSALDIPGTPPGKPDDGVNYLKFLTKMRSLIGKPTETFTISIAAPASYWYLKTFPIDKMAKVLDYIVYMTYDLHGRHTFRNSSGYFSLLTLCKANGMQVTSSVTKGALVVTVFAVTVRVTGTTMTQ